MKIKGLVDEDFVNYQKASMFIICPYCSFKCDKECGKNVCQNSTLAREPIIEYSTEKIIDRYLHNPITSAIVFGGLEPLDSWEELKDFIESFRKSSNDDIVIYTGYKEEEVTDKIEWLNQCNKNIIVKFGRFIPDQEPHIDPILGVKLMSPNQYSKILGI